MISNFSLKKNDGHDYDSLEYSLDCHFIYSSFHNLTRSNLAELQYSMGMSTCWSDSSVDSRSSLTESSS